MKNLILFVAICCFLGCKKTTIEDVSQYTWPLKSATISPALTIDGKLTTDFMRSESGSTCLANQYTLQFNANGGFAFTSNGPLCDMISFHQAKWTKNGDEIKLNSGFGEPITAKLENDRIVYESQFVRDGKSYTITYTFTAKKK